MAKHTPGPWTVTFDEYGDEIWFGGAGKGIHVIDTGNDTADIFLGGTSEAAFANARLVAAAPDLLAALKRLVEVGCCAGEGVIEAEEAIKKAEGQ